MYDRALVVARHGVAAIFSSLTFALFALLTLVIMSGVRFDTHTGHVYVVEQPYVGLLRAELRPAFGEDVQPVSAYDEEQAMSAAALLDRWAPYVAEASQRFGIPRSWIRAVMRQESGGRTVMANGRPITSQAGAQGLMQVMPDTYNDARAAYGLGNDAYNPHDNVIAGASYLRALYRKYGFPAMFAAYNDGPGNYEASLRGERELPKETQDYLASVTAHLGADVSRRHRRHRVTAEYASNGDASGG